MFTLLFFWIMLAIIVGVGASTRGRDGGGWFFLAILISPLLAGLLLLALPRFERTKILRGLRKCPFCAETVKLEAKVCKHCRSQLPMLIIKVESKEARAARLKVQDRQAIFGAVIAVLAILGLFAAMAAA
jgi:hypothetical protein